MRTICIDIDGTISHYIDWVDAQTFGEVLPKCAETIHLLKANGWFVIIYTTRSDKEEIKKFLDQNNIPFDAINENPNQPPNAVGGKPYADVYLDDRAIQFNGDWEDTYQKITGFHTWESSEIPNGTPTNTYSADFMIQDFYQSMEMLRHYDVVNWDVTKFAFSEFIIMLGACWAIFSFKDEGNVLPNLKWIVMGGISFASWLFSLIALYTISKNRTYFVRTSRHINEYRYHALSSKPMGFNNQSDFWFNPKYPKVKDMKSTQLICIYLLSFVSFILSLLTTIFIFYSINFKYSIITFISLIILTSIILYIIFKKVLREEFKNGL